MNEQFVIPNYPNYSIDREGVVRNVKTGHVVKPFDKGGYKQINLSKNGKVKKVYVHRLLGFVFLNLKEDQFIDHINGKKDDNRLENLRVCSRSENMRNAKGTKGYCIEINKGRNYYKAYICTNTKRISKCFPFTEEGKQKALKWRVMMEIEHFKEFANKV